jgi:hypothetical protein
VTVQLSPASTATSAALPEIAALLTTVFPRERPWEPDLDWQYLANPLGPAWYVNARNERGGLIAHYAVAPMPPLEDPRYRGLATFYSLNTAVHPDARVPGLMVATARALFRHLATLRSSIILGVANEQSYAGFTRLLGFHSLGRLALRMLAPWSLPGPTPARAVSLDDAYLRWRAARPGARMYVQPSRGAVLRRIQHAGLPVDVVLGVGLPSLAVERLASAHPTGAPWPPAPRLYATFGTIKPPGVGVPERLRPSPLQYIVLPLDKALDRTELAAHLATRRFEFLDFDVV